MLTEQDLDELYAEFGLPVRFMPSPGVPVDARAILLMPGQSHMDGELIITEPSLRFCQHRFPALAKGSVVVTRPDTASARQWIVRAVPRAIADGEAVCPLEAA